MAYSGYTCFVSLVCALAVTPFLIIPGESQVFVPSNVINCTIYNSSRPCLPGDRSVFCLTNGTVIRGICDAQLAVCQENAEVSDSMAPCLMQPRNNTGTSFMTSSNHQSLQVFSSSLLVWMWHTYLP